MRAYKTMPGMDKDETTIPVITLDPDDDLFHPAEQFLEENGFPTVNFYRSLSQEMTSLMEPLLPHEDIPVCHKCIVNAEAEEKLKRKMDTIIESLDLAQKENSRLKVELELYKVRTDERAVEILKLRNQLDMMNQEKRVKKSGSPTGTSKRRRVRSTSPPKQQFPVDAKPQITQQQQMYLPSQPPPTIFAAWKNVTTTYSYAMRGNYHPQTRASYPPLMASRKITSSMVVGHPLQTTANHFPPMTAMHPTSGTPSRPPPMAANYSLPSAEVHRAPIPVANRSPPMAVYHSPPMISMHRTPMATNRPLLTAANYFPPTAANRSPKLEANHSPPMTATDFPTMAANRHFPMTVNHSPPMSAMHPTPTTASRPPLTAATHPTLATTSGPSSTAASHPRPTVDGYPTQPGASHPPQANYPHTATANNPSTTVTHNRSPLNGDNKPINNYNNQHVLHGIDHREQSQGWFCICGLKFNLPALLCTHLKHILTSPVVPTLSLSHPAPSSTSAPSSSSGSQYNVVACDKCPSIFGDWSAFRCHTRTLHKIFVFEHFEQNEHNMKKQIQYNENNK